MRIALCDDEKHHIDRILGVLEEYRAPDGSKVVTDVYNNAIDLLANMRKTEYDALLMDIIMPGFTGIDAARDIRVDNMSIPIVFLTSSPEFAVESYRVHAFDYIMKPVEPENLCRTMDHIYALHKGRKRDAITINTSKEIYVVLLEQLEYLEVSNHVIYFHMLDGDVKEVRGKLVDYEDHILSRSNFIKVHRSYIINMSNMKAYDKKSFTAMTGGTIPVSRNLSKEVQDAYMDYLHNAIRK